MDTNDILAKENINRSDLFSLESEIKELPQLALENRHYFSDGLYARDLFMPAGSVITGQIHKKDHLTVIAYGDVTVVSCDEVASTRIRYTGFNVFSSKAGTKKAFYVNEDTMLITFHATDKKTVKDVELDLVTNSKDYLLEVVK